MHHEDVPCSIINPIKTIFKNKKPTNFTLKKKKNLPKESKDHHPHLRSTRGSIRSFGDIV